MIPHIYSETGRLKKVVLGSAALMGSTPTLEECYDAKSYESVQLGIYPQQSDVREEMTQFRDVLESHGVEVFRPTELDELNQVFARDICMAIGDRFIIPNIIEDRAEEVNGIQHVISQIHEDHIIELEEGVYVEGGDVMPWKGYLFVGYSPEDEFNKYKTARTNEKALNRLRSLFPSMKVRGFQLHKHDTDPREGVLHLDCCFQPIGTDQAIIYRGGFKHEADLDFLEHVFGNENLIDVDREEFYYMFPNVFSISTEVIVSNSSFTRLNSELRERGFMVEEIKYDEVSKMGGLLRCSTMPLIRLDQDK
ncbi:MAG: amidinotransferase [Flavobacteriales bacterium]|nr:amidinotransferase [Flavobacteriales bacterium]